MKKVIIDCDPGQDDAIALMLAHAAKDKMEVLGITTVAGNVQLKMTQRNARLICDMIGWTDAKVYAGSDSPLVRDLVTAEEYHGENGLNGIEIYEPSVPLQEKEAVNFIIDSLEEAGDGEITLVGIGPLTNIALVLTAAPHIKSKIKEIVIMGGSYLEGGNVTPAAEFNFYVDPHAAREVMDSGVPITVFGLDATHKARVSRKTMERIYDMPESPQTDILADSILYFAKAYKEIYSQAEPPIHDVLTIAYLIDPTLFSGRHCNLSVETDSELTLGQSVVDYWRLTDKIENVYWIDQVDKTGFFNLLIDRITKETE